MSDLMKKFEEDVIERMSRNYYDELLYFTASVPDALINFNDVLILKKGQKYVSHTNNLFQSKRQVLGCSNTFTPTPTCDVRVASVLL